MVQIKDDPKFDRAIERPKKIPENCAGEKFDPKFNIEIDSMSTWGVNSSKMEFFRWN